MTLGWTSAKALRTVATMMSILVSTSSVWAAEQFLPEVIRGKTLKQWDEDIRANPQDAKAYYWRGYLHFNRDERNEAISDFTEALKLKPNYIEALRERASAYMYMARYTEALADAEKAVKLDEEEPNGYQMLGSIYNATEQYGKALTTWKHYLSFEDSAYGRYNLATVLTKLGRYDEALRELAHTKLLDEKHYLSSYIGIEGLAYAFSNRYPKAYQSLQSALGSEQARGVERMFKAYCDVCLHKQQDADAAVAKGLAEETFPPRGHRLAGEIFRTAGNLDKALSELTQSCSMEAYPPGFRQRATVYIAKGDIPKAYDDLKKSLQLNPSSPVTLSCIAYVENKLGHKEDAENHIKLAFERGPVMPIAYVYRAHLRLDQGDLNEAMNNANAAIDADPWLKEGYEVRAIIYEKQKDSAKQSADTKKASELVSHLDF